MQYILENQPDFLAQKCIIQEIIESKGHKIIFYSKFHCELNYIEMYWRQQSVIQEIIVTIYGMDCNGLFLDHISLSKIRAYARKSYRYMDAYKKGLNVKQAEYAVKKYKRHCIIPNNILEDILIKN